MFIQGGYKLSVVPSEDGGPEKPCCSWLVKAEPINAFGYLFYAYPTQEQAGQVLYNLEHEPNRQFDDQTYRVNFSPRNGRILWMPPEIRKSRRASLIVTPGHD